MPQNAKHGGNSYDKSIGAEGFASKDSRNGDDEEERKDGVQKPDKAKEEGIFENSFIQFACPFFFLK